MQQTAKHRTCISELTSELEEEKKTSKTSLGKEAAALQKMVQREVFFFPFLPSFPCFTLVIQVYTWTWCLLSLGKEAASENGVKRGFLFFFFFPSLFHPCHPGVYTNLVFTRVRSWLVIRAYDTDLILYDGVVSCPCDIDLMLVWSNPARGAGARKGAISRRARAGVTGKSQNFSNFISIASAYSKHSRELTVEKF